jgi:hypothetical protein
VAADRDGGVRVVGLRELQRDMARIAPKLEEAVEDGGLEQVEQRIASEASSRAVRQTGTYAASIIRLPTGGVGSLLPQAGVLHWGGVVRPRGVDITFPRRPVVSEAQERLAPQVVDRVGDLLDEAARKAGWDR